MRIDERIEGILVKFLLVLKHTRQLILGKYFLAHELGIGSFAVY